jgi:hypothetical protein
MVVTDLKVVGAAFKKAEANTPLIIDRDRVLTLPITFQLMEPVSRWIPQIFQLCRQIQILQLA